VDDVEGVPPRRVQPLFAAPAQFVKSDRGKGADESEAGGKWKKERHNVVSEGRAAERDADDGVDKAEKDDVGGHGPKVVEALG